MAKYCPVCGKIISEGYQPLDSIRSSYGMQRKPLATPETPAPTINLFHVERNSISDTAWACVVYSMVPYIGVLFIPLAFVTGGIGYLAAQRRPQNGGGRLAIACVGLSFAILAVQIFLWWLLYIIPEIAF